LSDISTEYEHRYGENEFAICFKESSRLEVVRLRSARISLTNNLPYCLRYKIATDFSIVANYPIDALL
jgi:hypothetical protein